MSETLTQQEHEVRAFLKALTGTWEGHTKTWFDPQAEPQTGATQTTFEVLLDDLFLQETYSSAIGPTAHRGSRILGFDRQDSKASCYWVDSLHTGAKAMLCSGAIEGALLSVLGSYSGDGEIWGWRTEFERLAPNTLVVKQFNIWPSGKTDLAVETRLQRTSAETP